MLIGDYHEKQWLLSLTSGCEGVRLDMFFIYCARKATHYVYIYVLGSLGDIIFNYEGTKISSFSSSPWISPINSIRFRQHPEGKKWRKKYVYNFSIENVSSVANFISDHISSNTPIFQLNLPKIYKFTKFLKFRQKSR